VRTVSGRKLQIQPSAAVDISPDGTVTQNGQPLGRIQIGDFADTGALVKQGASYYRSDAAAQAAQGTQIEQGKLETSNVGVAESSVRLVDVMRQFEMLEKAAMLGTEMNRESIEQVGRVAS